MGSLTDENIRALSPFFNAHDTVVVAPLNWGLGHAARCIPIIEWLKDFCNVVVASDGQALELLKKEFPDLTFYELPSYNIRYRYKGIFINMLYGSPDILKAIIKEHAVARKLAKETRATIILSDNRPGFFTSITKNYYMTHQLKILHHNRLISKVGTRIHNWFISKFDLCLIPDYKGQQALCPALSSSINQQGTYLGIISRIKKLYIPIVFDILVVLSGPEPQRTKLENELCHSLGILNEYKILFIRGTSNVSNHGNGYNHILVKDFAGNEEMTNALNSSKLLISRSGYTTLMDISNLNIKAILIPTPGQTEQEYLADFHLNNPKYKKLNQNELNKLQKTIKSLI